MLTAAIDTLDEVDYYRHGGILHYVLRQRLATEPPRAAPIDEQRYAMATIDSRRAVENPPPVDLAALQAFMVRLYEDSPPAGVVDDLIAERRREADDELTFASRLPARRSGHEHGPV